MRKVAMVQNAIARQMAELIGRYKAADQQVKRFRESNHPQGPRRRGELFKKPSPAGNSIRFRLLAITARSD